MAPLVLLSPPSTAPVKPFRVSDVPSAPPARVMGAMSTPASAAKPKASPKATERLRDTLMPAAVAARPSVAAAIIPRPSRVRLIMKPNPMPTTSTTAQMTTLCHVIRRLPRSNPPLTTGGKGRAFGPHTTW